MVLKGLKGSTSENRWNGFCFLFPFWEEGIPTLEKL